MKQYSARLFGLLMISIPVVILAIEEFIVITTMEGAGFMLGALLVMSTGAILLMMFGVLDMLLYLDARLSTLKAAER